MTTIQRKNGEIYGDLPVPTKLNYIFMGWYTENGGLGNKVNSTDVINTSADYSIYAYWEKAARSIDLFKNLDEYITDKNGTYITIPFDGVLTYDILITDKIKKLLGGSKCNLVKFVERFLYKDKKVLQILLKLGSILSPNDTVGDLHMKGTVNVRANDVLCLPINISDGTIGGENTHAIWQKYKNALSDPKLSYMILTEHTKVKGEYFPLEDRQAYEMSKNGVYNKLNDVTASVLEKAYIKLTDDEIHLIGGSGLNLTIEFSDLNIGKYKKMQIYDCCNGYPDGKEHTVIIGGRFATIKVKDSTGKKYESAFAYRTMNVGSNSWSEWKEYKKSYSLFDTDMSPYIILAY